MGYPPGIILCDDIDVTKWYIVEVDVHGGGDPLTGCARPFWQTWHEPIDGWGLKGWVCGEQDCVEGATLVMGIGDAQRLVKVFGPYINQADAWAHMW